jgi:serine/threonine protein kinase
MHSNYDNQLVQDGGKKKKEIKLINSGAAGCIYRPSITCKGDIGSSKYITKIQKNTRTIAHELRISEKIRKIKGYARYFAPVLKHCTVKFKKDLVKDLKKCELFEKDSEQTIAESSYISMKTRYIGNTDMQSHFAKFNSSNYVNELLKNHTHILYGLQKMFANRIVHYDLKHNNIIFDDEQNAPIIIDFGQSWVTTELETEEQLSSSFFVFNQYDYWSIDVVICSYIIQIVGIGEAKTALVTEAEMEHIYDVFMYGRPQDREPGEKKIVNDLFLNNVLQNPQKMFNFKIAVFEYARSFINKRTWWELYRDLITYADTWDCYSSAVIFLLNLDDIYLYNADFYNHIIKSNKLLKYIALLETILYSTPSSRPKLNTVLSEMKSIIQR